MVSRVDTTNYTMYTHSAAHAKCLLFRSKKLVTEQETTKDMEREREREKKKKKRERKQKTKNETNRDNVWQYAGLVCMPSPPAGADIVIVRWPVHRQSCSDARWVGACKAAGNIEELAHEDVSLIQSSSIPAWHELDQWRCSLMVTQHRFKLILTSHNWWYRLRGPSPCLCRGCDAIAAARASALSPWKWSPMERHEQDPEWWAWYSSRIRLWFLYCWLRQTTKQRNVPEALAWPVSCSDSLSFPWSKTDLLSDIKIILFSWGWHCAFAAPPTHMHTEAHYKGCHPWYSSFVTLESESPVLLADWDTDSNSK